MTKNLYRFSHDFGRMGALEGTFVATEADIEKIAGKEIGFGEALGKHSDISCVIERGENLDLVTDDQEFIAKAEEYGLTPSGYNPLDYLNEEEEESDESEDDDDDFEEDEEDEDEDSDEE